MLFSVIVPIYNVGIYLEKCINSVLNQSYKSFELILVDDGSTDNSPEICDYYSGKDERIRVIHKKNGGLVSARKAGAEVAIGDYAVCVDGDDWIHEDHLISLYNVIKEHAPEVVCFNFFEVINDNYLEKKLSFNEGLYTKKELITNVYPFLIESAKGVYFPPCVWAKAFKMELYKQEQLEVDERINMGEDVACSVPCIAKANNMYVLDKSLYFYRRNNLSMTKNKKPFSWDVPLHIDLHLRNRLQILGYNDFDLQINRRTTHAIINVIKSQFYQRNNYFNVVKEIKHQLKINCYNKIINNCVYSPFTLASVICYFLKHNFYFPIYLLSKIK